MFPLFGHIAKTCQSKCGAKHHNIVCKTEAKSPPPSEGNNEQQHESDPRIDATTNYVNAKTSVLS